MKDPTKDRREHPRFNFNLPLKIRDLFPNIWPHKTTTFTLSKGGISFPLKKSLRLDKNYMTQISFPNAKKISASVNALWIETHDQQYMHRVKFKESAEQINFLETFLQSMQKGSKIGDRRLQSRSRFQFSLQTGNNISQIENSSNVAKSSLQASVDDFIRLSRNTKDSSNFLFHQAISALHEMCGKVADCEKLGVKKEDILSIITEPRRMHSKSPFLWRLQNWPRGYCGDFETIEYLIKQRNHSKFGSIEYYLEEYALGSMIAQQHRNKVRYQSEMILQTLHNTHQHSRDRCKILIIACGSCPDVELIIPYLNNYDYSLILNDNDKDAIKLSSSKLKALDPNVKYFPGSIFRSLSSILEEGPFDLVLAGGLFDYLTDRQIEFLLKKARTRLLKNNGKFIFTNIARGNPFRQWIEYFVDWILIERDEKDILQLVKSTGFSEENIKNHRDSTGLTILSEVVKT